MSSDNLQSQVGEKIFDLTGVSVCIAIPCYSGIVPVETALAIAQTVVRLKEMGVRVDICSERENGLITAVRNKLIARFLNESKADYIFWLDDDIIFTPDDFISVLAFATLNKMSAAVYPVRKDEPKFFLKYINEGKHPEFDEYGMIKAKGLGLGFTCIHKSIIEEIVNCNGTYEEYNQLIPDVFKIGVKNNKYWGEDMWFFHDLYEKGHIVYVNPLINLKHSGRKDYAHKLLDYVIKE